MTGFVGSRIVFTTPDGLTRQLLQCNSDADVEFWRKIFPRPDAADCFPFDVNPLHVYPRSEMSWALGPDGHLLTCQSVEERDEWRKTFQEHHGVTKFARWVNQRQILIGSELKPLDSVTSESPPPPSVDLDAMTDAQLRTKAIELDLGIEPDEPRAITMNRIIEALTAPE